MASLIGFCVWVGWLLQGKHRGSTDLKNLSYYNNRLASLVFLPSSLHSAMIFDLIVLTAWRGGLLGFNLTHFVCAVYIV